MALHLSTYLTRSSAGLLSRIQSLTKKYAGHDLTLLFALSANVPDLRDLERAVSGLTTGFTTTQTVGCLSGRLGSTNLNGKLLESDMLSLAVAVFDSGTVAPFRSTIPGKEEAQVGRWHAFRKRGDAENESYVLDADVPWGDVWNRDFKDVLLPEELQALNVADIRTILYLSDLKPEGLLSSLQKLPSINKLGLLASSTPFITGLPVTLLRDREVFRSGAVGLAIKQSTPAPVPQLDIDFLGVRRLGNAMVVTQSEGNMVNSLNNDNPTQLLLSVIKNAGLSTHIPGSFKEEEQFSLGALSSGDKIKCAYKITAGDPSRGSLSIDSPTAPEVGTVVQFLHRPTSAVPTLSLPSFPPTLKFLTVSDELQPQVGDTSVGDFELVIEDTFLTASENGFILDDAKVSRESIKCSLPGSLGSLYWPDPKN